MIVTVMLIKTNANDDYMVMVPVVTSKRLTN